MAALRSALGRRVTAAHIPLGGQITSMALTLLTLMVLMLCFTRRFQNIRRLSKLPLSYWLLLLIYADSILFVFASALVKDLGVNNSHTLCQTAIILCLSCYLTTKILVYYFLVEKAHIVRGRGLTRMKDKVYLFNCFGMMVPYCGVAILNFVLRIGYINNKGTCIIGMEKPALVPLIAFDVLVNVYLTISFLVPLRRLHSFKAGTNQALHRVAFRTFIGSCATLTSSVVNLLILTLLDGEPGWICLLACNADILFTVLVLHWVTVNDTAGGSSYDNQYANRPTGNTGPVQGFANSGTVKSHHHGTINDERPTVSTRITASRPKEHSTDIVLDAIHVNTVQVQQIEFDARSSSSGNEEGYRASSLSESTAPINSKHLN